MERMKSVLRTDEVAEERDLVGVYLHEISKTPLLDAAQEVDLSKAIEAGLYAEQLLESEGLPDGVTEAELRRLVLEGEDAKDRFIRANLRLVVSIARRYVRSGMPMLDLIQEGNTGLVRAVEKFDYERGYKFSTYATWWVRQAISRAIAQQERTVRLPVHLVEDVNRMRSAARQFTREHGSDPEPEQLAVALGVPVERVHELKRWSQDTVSLDTPVGDDGDTSLGDLVGVYLHEISRTPLLDAASEVELSKAVEAGLYAEHLLETGDFPDGVTAAELERVVADGERAKDRFIRANLRLVVSIARLIAWRIHHVAYVENLYPRT